MISEPVANTTWWQTLYRLLQGWTRGDSRNRTTTANQIDTRRYQENCRNRRELRLMYKIDPGYQD